MKQENTAKLVISKLGLTSFKEMLEAHTGETFSVQQINHWKSRGIPYRWHDDVAEALGVSKAGLRTPAESQIQTT